MNKQGTPESASDLMAAAISRYEVGVVVANRNLEEIARKYTARQRASTAKKRESRRSPVLPLPNAEVCNKQCRHDYSRRSRFFQ